MSEERIKSGTGEIFDPKKVKLGKKPGSGTAKIIGAHEIEQGEPTILDKRTKQEQAPVEVTEHEEIVTVQQHVRSKPKRKDEPEVRIRSLTSEAKDSWGKARRGEE